MKSCVRVRGWAVGFCAAVAGTCATAAVAAAGEPRSSPAVQWSAGSRDSVVAEERSFRSGSATLAGTLFVPKGGSRVPALIALHAASAPTRDNPLYAHLSEMLPPLGIAVFIFDRRGSGASGGMLEDSDYTMLADDAINAQRMLMQDRRIDPGRIGFWGLSQGGWLALLAASRSADAAFAISVSAPMTTPDVQMNFAVANILRIKGFSEGDVERAIATRSAVDDFMRGLRDRASTQRMLDAAATEPWFFHAYLQRTFRDPDRSGWAREMRHDPMEVLDSVRQPTLLIYGSEDPWIPVRTSLERLRARPGRHAKVDIALVNGADHAMATTVPIADQIDPDMSARSAPQSAAYFGLVGAWLAAQGVVRREMNRE